jgi:hypothetical protein
MPEAARVLAAVGAQRRGIDGAEHSAILSHVMAENPGQLHRTLRALSHGFLDAFGAHSGARTRAADTTA